MLRGDSVKPDAQNSKEQFSFFEPADLCLRLPRLVSSEFWYPCNKYLMGPIASSCKHWLGALSVLLWSDRFFIQWTSTIFFWFVKGIQPDNVWSDIFDKVCAKTWQSAGRFISQFPLFWDSYSVSCLDCYELLATRQVPNGRTGDNILCAVLALVKVPSWGGYKRFAHVKKMKETKRYKNNIKNTAMPRCCILVRSQRYPLSTGCLATVGLGDE